MSVSKRNLKKMCAIALTPVAAFAIMGGNLPLAQAAAPQPVVLRFDWWGSQVRDNLTLKVIQLYEQLHPNVKIEPEYMGWSGYWDKLATEAAGGTAPDIMQMSVLYLKDYAAKGALLDLTPYQNKGLSTTDLDQNILSQGRVDGKLYGIPFSENSTAMVFNAAMYKKAGVKPPTPGWNWNDFFNIARQMKPKLKKGQYAATDSSSDFEEFQYYLNSVGDHLYNGNQLGYNDKNLKNWLTMWDTARKQQLVPPPGLSAEFANAGGDPTKDPVMKGIIPIEPEWTSGYPLFTNVGSNFQMVPVPDGKFTANVLETSMLFVASSQTQHPKEAADFLNFIENNPAAAAILGTERGVPDNKYIVAHLNPKFSSVEKAQIKIIQYTASHHARWYDSGPQGADQLGTLFTQMVQKEQFGQLSVSQLVQQFRQQANQALQQANN